MTSIANAIEGYPNGDPNAPPVVPQTPPVTPPPTTAPEPVNLQQFKAPTVGYDPERITIDNDTDTVEGRIGKIIAKNSAPMRQAETRGIQRMAQRGLANSSMAVGAAQGALYDYALPIAQQDANNSLQVKGQNQAAGNTQAQFKAGAENTAALGIQNAESSVAGGMQQDAALAEIQKERDTYLNQMTVELEELRQKHDKVIAAGNQAGNLYAQAMQSIQAIMADETITPADKQTQTDKIIQMTDSGMALTGGINGLDLSQFLTFTYPGSTNTAAAPAAVAGAPAYTLPANFAQTLSWL